MLSSPVFGVRPFMPLCAGERGRTITGLLSYEPHWRLWSQSRPPRSPAPAYCCWWWYRCLADPLFSPNGTIFEVSEPDLSPSMDLQPTFSTGWIVPTASLSTALLSGLNLGAFRVILSIFIALSRLDT